MKTHTHKKEIEYTNTEKEIEYTNTIMEMRNIVINQERVIEELMLEKLYTKEKRILYLYYYYDVMKLTTSSLN